MLRLDCIKNFVSFLIILTTSSLISFTHPFEPIVQSSFVPLHSSSLLSSVALSLSCSAGSLSTQSQMEELTPGVNRSDFRELKMAEGTSLSLAFYISHLIGSANCKQLFYRHPDLSLNACFVLRI